MTEIFEEITQQKILYSQIKKEVLDLRREVLSLKAKCDEKFFEYDLDKCTKTNNMNYLFNKFKDMENKEENVQREKKINGKNNFKK